MLNFKAILNYLKPTTVIISSRYVSNTTNKNLILLSTTNNVTRMTLNNPKKLNGWDFAMMARMKECFQILRKDDETKVVLLTGSDPYYGAGANLSGYITLKHPKTFHAEARDGNEELFNNFLDFPKPILVAANGPALGATVTASTLCDGILASERATFLTPFVKLKVPAEGCSSVHFERILGKDGADRMLLKGEKISAKDAKEIGLVIDVVPHEDLLQEAQKIAESWVSCGKKRAIPGNQNVEEYREVNKRESVQVADAFLSYNFLDYQENFLRSKGKSKEARMFWILKVFRPLWSKLL